MSSRFPYFGDRSFALTLLLSARDSAVALFVMDPSNFWDETGLNGAIKCEGNLNFSTVASEDDEYGYHKKKLSRDPLSHRIIEKRRRDRMNNCLADLSRLLPSEYMKKGRGRIEKTEIIEMAIKHMKHLQSHPCTEGSCCPVSLQQHSQQQAQQQQQPLQTQQHHHHHQQQHGEDVKAVPIVAEHYKLGFHECLSETMHFLVEVEGFFAGDALCVQLISHLQRHCDNILKGSGFLRLGSDRDISDRGMVNGNSGNHHHHQHQQHGPQLVAADWSSPSGRWSPVGSRGCGRLSNSAATTTTTTTNDVMMMMMSTTTKEEPEGSDKLSLDSTPPPPPMSLQSVVTLPQPPPPLLMINSHHNPRHLQHHPHPDTSGSETGSNHASNCHNELSPSSQHSDKTESQYHLNHNSQLEPPTSLCSSTNYKFKNNIRKRFAHQREEEEHQNFGGGGTNSSRGGVVSAPAGIERRQSRNSSGSSNGHHQHHPDTTTSSTTVAPNSGLSVPIFALSTRGSYYIPLSIDYSLLAAHLEYYHGGGGGGGGDTPVSEDSDQAGNALTNATSSTSSTSSSGATPPGLILHPVTISVNFRPPRLHTRERDYYHLVDNT